MDGERERRLRLEVQILTDFGYAHCLDMPLTGRDGSLATREDGSVITGGSFLDLYSDAEKRQHTEDVMRGLDPTDPNYAEDQAYVGTYLKAFFGPPRPAA